MSLDIQRFKISICMDDDDHEEFSPDGEEISESVNDLISQLKENHAEVKSASNNDQFQLKPEELEQFILNSTGKLIQDSMDMVSTVKQYVQCAPDADGVSSLAELLKATTSSIDTLGKILVQDKKSDTSTKLKQLDIASKQQLQEADHSNKLTLTRQEMLDKLIESADIVDVTSETDINQEPPQ